MAGQTERNFEKANFPLTIFLSTGCRRAFTPLSPGCTPNFANSAICAKQTCLFYRPSRIRVFATNSRDNILNQKEDITGRMTRVLSIRVATNHKAEKWQIKIAIGSRWCNRHPISPQNQLRRKLLILSLQLHYSIDFDLHRFENSHKDMNF